MCVVGSVNADLSFTVPTLPGPGETVLATSLTTAPGGKGANQAVAAARAGAQVQFVGAVGDDDAGAALRTHLQCNGVGTDGLSTLPGASGTAVVVVDDAAENLIVVAPGANGALTLDDAARSVVAASDVLLLQLEIPVPTAVAAAEAARAAGATVILNASPAGAEVSALAGLVDVVVVNEAEDRAWRWPVAHRVVTRGARGAVHHAGEDTVEVPAPRVDAHDTTGAGDVFAGVLATHWHLGPREALRRACAAGALATLTPGAGNCAPTADAIDHALEETP